MSKKRALKGKGRKLQEKAGLPNVAGSPAEGPSPAPATKADPNPDELILRTTENLECRMRNLHRLFNLSRYWIYVVGNRQRLSEEARMELRKESQKHLVDLGVSEEFLREVAQRGLVEVSMTFSAEQAGWERRIVPWESLLSLATKLWRGERHLTVVRHLARPNPQASSPPVPMKALLVASSPGELGEIYDFRTEMQLIASSLAPSIQGEAVLKHDLLTPEQLEDIVSKEQPDLVHLSGVDAHQGAVLLGLPQDPDRHDGFYLAGSGLRPLVVEAEPMGHRLTAGRGFGPLMVAFNCYYSGARLAAMAVASGAQMALGFQDTVDDTVAERFFASFYTAWRRGGWGNALGAFARARDDLATQMQSLPTERQGGDVVLWTCRSLVWAVPAPAAPALATPMPAPAAAVQAPANPKESLQVEVTAVERLNYSLLHNDRSPFEVFRIHKYLPDWCPDVEVEVRLDAGEVSIPYQAIRRLTAGATNVQVRLPLVASVFRQLREGIYTSIFVEVRCGGAVVHRDTYRVTLLPGDEWTDTPADRLWLPSFVLPRDPAVQRLLDGAAHYLRALADDSSAGFDGYQRVAFDGSDPQGAVDCQVRAIWSALLYEKPLGYINPPPTYTPGAQRVRTPSQIMRENRGTCLDIALLMAACLEYLGLMPVLFLVKGHAFPGYWRSEQARLRLLSFKNASQAGTAPAPTKDSSGGACSTTSRWIFGPDVFPELVPCLQSGGLVPVESLELTERGSFNSALERGLKNLLTGWSFDAMIDIQSARAATPSVTPLPLFDEHPRPL